MRTVSRAPRVFAGLYHGSSLLVVLIMLPLGFSEGTKAPSAVLVTLGLLAAWLELSAIYWRLVSQAGT